MCYDVGIIVTYTSIFGMCMRSRLVQRAELTATIGVLEGALIFMMLAVGEGWSSNRHICSMV